MNGVVFADDCQIVKGSFAKVYGPAALVTVTVRPIVLRQDKLMGAGDAVGRSGNVSYQLNPAKRGLGFLISILVIAGLCLNTIADSHKLSQDL